MLGETPPFLFLKACIRPGNVWLFSCLLWAPMTSAPTLNFLFIFGIWRIPYLELDYAFFVVGILFVGLFLVLSFSSTSMNLGCFVCVSSVYCIIWIYWLTLKSIFKFTSFFSPSYCWQNHTLVPSIESEEEQNFYVLRMWMNYHTFFLPFPLSPSMHAVGIEHPLCASYFSGCWRKISCSSGAYILVSIGS